MTPSPGQIPALIAALVSAVLDAVTAFAPTALNSTEKTAVLAVFSAAIPIAIIAAGYFGHSFAIAQARAGVRK
jgi:hypothetical protein